VRRQRVAQQAAEQVDVLPKSFMWIVVHMLTIPRPTNIFGRWHSTPR
jgi:hypothetical protein